MIKLSTGKESVEIKDFAKNGDEIKVEFTNKFGEKRYYVIRVSARGRILMN